MRNHDPIGRFTSAYFHLTHYIAQGEAAPAEVSSEYSSAMRAAESYLRATGGHVSLADILKAKQRLPNRAETDTGPEEE
jgi:hypothetical protein